MTILTEAEINSLDGPRAFIPSIADFVDTIREKERQRDQATNECQTRDQATKLVQDERDALQKRVTELEAELESRLIIKPNLLHASEFQRLSAEAERNAVGLWSACRQ